MMTGSTGRRPDRAAELPRTTVDDPGGVTEQVGRFVTGVDLTALPQQVTERATVVLLDTIGCLLGGWSTPEAARLTELLDRRGNCGSAPVVGSTRRAAPEIAALVNGTLIAALGYDDVARVMGGHPSGAVVAAIVAETGRRTIGGPEALGAYVLGVEISARVGNALGPEHSRRGWHTTATAGVFGAVAALARLRGLDAGCSTHALGIATSLSAGLKSSFTTMTRAVHTGWAAHSAMLAVDMAEAGLTGQRHGLEAPDGFIAAYGGPGSDPARIVARLGDPWVFSAPGDGLKLYPCHGATHRGLEAALLIREESGLRPDDIASVRCYNPPPWFSWVPRLRPASGQEGRFSMEYILAAALVDGHIGIHSFTDDAVARPEVRALFARIDLVEDAAFQPPDPYAGDPDRPPYEGFVRVEITSVSGRTWTRDVEQPPGAPGRVLDRQAVERKFLECAVSLGGMEEPVALDLAAALHRITACTDLSGLLGSASVRR
ncbi:MmgE/PrpD family protein [Streptomyces sp. NBC_00988]|uniref:MmgE/PrpD family protein n=1 Tax=Streptomyces sp. NBC_00988 TaxID=2903704 RepID=UPI0038699F66|nr:MmgE/PrpD family protein [Streptomyces sp. NBC_00988]